MTAEAKTGAEIPSPQEKALTIIKLVIRAQDVLEEFGQAGVSDNVINALRKSILKAQDDILLHGIKPSERAECIALINFSKLIYADPDGIGQRTTKYQMKQRGYSSLEIDSFIQTVEATNEFRHATVH